MKASDILAKMSLEDKLKLTSGRDFWHLESFEQYGLPEIMVTDGPHGVRKQVEVEGEKTMGINKSEHSTAFPTASLSACSWDRDVIEEMGDALGKECLSMGVGTILGPGLNIKRNPLCGRNFEYFSEDPVLAGEITAAYVKGVQKNNVGTCVKHFAANSQETSRMTSMSNIDERALREIYLQGFEIAVKKAQPWSIMASYNGINGTFASANKWLLTDVLRKEWGFGGLVMTDWGGGHDHATDLIAGLDLEMPGNGQIYLKATEKAFKKGLISMETIDRAATKVIEMILKAKENPKSGEKYNIEKHHLIARKVAEKSIVLLKNEKKALPISDKDDLIVIGEMAKTPRYQGAGSSHLDPYSVDTLFNQLEDNKVKFDYAAGYSCAQEKSEDYIKEAVEKIKDGQKVILCIGLTDSYESEGSDRFNMRLPEVHVKLAEAVLAKTDNVVLVLFGGSPVELPFIGKVKACVNAYLSGEAGAAALCDILTGKVNPSGKLAETWPLAYEDVPNHKTYAFEEKCQVNYRDSIFVGYRYYDAAKKEVLFPFGFGLSYTTFEYSDIKVDKNVVTFTVTNTGKVDGEEVCQLYISNKTNADIFAVKDLRNFAKVALKAGESKEVKIELTDRDFQYYNVEKKAYVTAAGKYEILVGSSSRDIKLQAEIEKKGEAIKYPAKYKGTWFETFNGLPTDADFEVVYGAPAIKYVPVKKGHYTIENTVLDIKDSLLGKIMIKAMSIVAVKVLNIPKGEENLPQNKMMIECTMTTPFRSMAAMSGGMMPLWLAKMLIGMANGFSSRK